MCLEGQTRGCCIGAETVIGCGLRELCAHGDVGVVGQGGGLPGGEAVGVAVGAAGGAGHGGGEVGCGGERGQKPEVIEFFAGIVFVLGVN